MSNIARFKNGKAEYLVSVNTPDYSSDPDVIVNPDITVVQNVPLRYWKRAGDLVQEMSASEKGVVDQAELDAKEAQVQALEIDVVVLAKALVKAGVITKTALINAIK